MIKLSILSINYEVLIINFLTDRKGFAVDWGMKFLLYGPSLCARPINKKFQPEVWNFTV